ncbi:MAG TPA: GH116 family glycosyl hydrolase [Candidatus Methylacidiphilales bacterium]|nr:GH116 family glycosyl hydrolase [Candidatus Methylacidiphilales bacterium]
MKRQEPIFPFQHREILQTAMPLGGLGAGSICFNGYGGLQDFALYNRPATTALPDGHRFTEAAFGVLHVVGSNGGNTRPRVKHKGTGSPKASVTRLLEGPLPAGKIYDQGLQGQGFRHGAHEGLPRFRNSRFSSGYPFGRVALSDPLVPLEVAITGWNPFIPLDDIASGIPCALLEYTFQNTSAEKVEFQFSYHLSHLASSTWGGTAGRNRIIPGKGVLFTNTEPSGSESFGSASVTMIGQRPVVKAMWLRAGWFDSISVLWRELEAGRMEPNDGVEDEGRDGRNGGSVLVKASLEPGASLTVPVAITWYFPNSNQAHGGQPEDQGGDAKRAPRIEPRWKTFYSRQWKDAADVAGYIHRNFAALRARTVAFQRALLGSTLPRPVLDAVSANLAILKSPTVLRQDNGNLWGWEGCFTDHGSCHGTCTHVWNYAQSLPHLFPQLERTLRETELRHSMDERGHVNFRAALPTGPVSHGWHAAADGQLGGIMKLYRDWHISGDTPWLRDLYPLARRSLEYCIGAWDPDRKGALFEPHHNTYDIEFWGPDGMCGSIYIGALCAMSAMAEALGEAADSKTYLDLARKGARYMEKELFNGEYFAQKVMYKGLRDTSFADLMAGTSQDESAPGGSAWQYGTSMGKMNESVGTMRLLRAEGPKYQYGEGCLSDGVIGAWMARIYGIETPLASEKIRQNLAAIFRHNFRTSLFEHAILQRPGYAMGDEPGLMVCTWPHGKKPMLPFVYCDEVFTGIEYQVASHMIAEGMVEEGLAIVAATRSRHNNGTRNPWNEYECGNYYARAMASYALLGAYSGFRYSRIDRTLWFAPKTDLVPFRTFFSTATAFSTIGLGRNSITVAVAEGELDICTLKLTMWKGEERDISVDTTVTAAKPLRIPL